MAQAIHKKDEYSEAATDAELLRTLVKYAVLAPSGHNTQPWLFRIAAERLDLLADRTRCLPVVDPRDRALTISCGAALEHLAIAARRFGREPEVVDFPGGDPDLLATVRLAGEISPNDQEMLLFEIGRASCRERV